MTDEPRPSTGQGAHRPPTLDRRELLAALTSLLAALGLPGRALAQSGGERTRETAAFADLVDSLAGFPPDPVLVDQFYDAFASEADDLVRLHEIVANRPEAEWQAAIEDAGLSPLAEALVTAWYSGAVGDGPNARVITYLDAFAWYAVGYTKPPTRCADAFGGWADEPHEMR